MGSGVVEKRQQHVPVLGQFGDGFGVLIAVDSGELVDAGIGVGPGFGPVDLMQGCFGLAVEPLG